MKKNTGKIINQYINGNIVNIGGAPINISNSILGGSNNFLDHTADIKQNLSDIVDKIERLSFEIDEDRTDIAKEILSIRGELSRKDSSFPNINTAFNSICKLASKFVDKGIETIAEEGIKMLIST
jgi:hypothetical protein